MKPKGAGEACRGWRRETQWSKPDPRASSTMLDSVSPRPGEHQRRPGGQGLERIEGQLGVLGLDER